MDDQDDLDKEEGLEEGQDFHMPQMHEHRPPTKSIEVRCVHCGEVFDSSKMTWSELEVVDGQSCGVWKCPTDGCIGADFGHGMFPTDPNFKDEEGREVVWRDEDGNPGRPMTWSEVFAAMPHEPRTPENDPMRPPKKNTEVTCLHCGQKYDSYRIEWREFEMKDGTKEGFWCCPIPGCDGRGFCFDIYPTDPNYPEQDEDGRHLGGWFDDDGNRVPPPGAED